MNYDEVKSILKDKKLKGEITLKQYFSLVSQARKKYFGAEPEETLQEDALKDPTLIFDGKL